MKTSLRSASIISLLLLGACGGGSDDPPQAASPSPPPPVRSTPTPTPVPAPVAVAPAPVIVVGDPIPTTPVEDTDPVEVDPTPPTPEEPPAPPEPAPGTYVLGKVVKAALRADPFSLANCANYQYAYYYYVSECDTAAYESADSTKDAIYVGYWDQPDRFTHYSYPKHYNYNAPNPKYPEATVEFSVVYPNSIFALSRQLKTSSNGEQVPLVRADGDFEIEDDMKFILDTSAATWKGVEGKEQYFLQLQVSSFHPDGATEGEASEFIFKLCMHEYFPSGKSAIVRRLACTLHNRDTGAYMGTQVLDDSRGLGSTEYLPLNE